MCHFARNINLDKILDKIVRYLFDKNILYCDSIDSYYSRKEPSLWRKIIFYLRFFLLVIVFVKYGLLLLYPDTLQWTTLKDFTLIFGKQANLLHAMLLSPTMVTILGKLIIFYCERHKNIKVIDMIVDWKARKPLFQINERHLKKLTLNSLILYYGFIRITASLSFFIATFIFTWMTIATYLFCNYGNVIILILWSIIVMITSDNIITTLLFVTYMFFFPITLLNYLFDELIKKLRVSIRWNNEKRLYQVLHSYNDLIAIVSQLGVLFNHIIGLVYCLVPYILALFVEIFKIERDDILFKIVKIFSVVFFIVANLTAFLINQMSASITVRNKSIHKYLYPMFIKERKTRIPIKLSIDSFIARLNTQFIGFYCFNLFPFTKMAFYQYAFSVSTCYFLLTRILNNNVV